MAKSIKRATAVSQAELAALFGRPTHWLRSHAHEVPRLADGQYDTAEVFEWFMQKRPVEPAVLSDAEVEGATKFCEAFADALSYDVGDLVELLSQLEARHSAGGLVAFVATLRRELKAARERLTPRPSEDEIRERHDARLVHELDESVPLLDSTIVCETCGKQRFGLGWIPRTHMNERRVILGLCPMCEEKSSNGGTSQGRRNSG